MKHPLITFALLFGSWLYTSIPTVHGQDLQPDRAYLKVHVPQANATLTVDGVPTKQMGPLRTLLSPPFTGSGYTYTLKVSWEPNNYTKITRQKVVAIEPGKTVEVDLRQPDPRWKDDIVVRFVPTPNQVVEAMCRLAKVGKDDVVYDLGCGDGRMVILAVEQFDAKKGIGIDIDPQRVKESLARAANSSAAERLEFRQGDVLKIDDLPNASVVLLYMGEDINRRLKPILQAKLKPGSRVVSHRFLMGADWPPQQSETIDVNGTHYDIHLWVIGEKKQSPAKRVG
jgi:uncharacterized protein (TIGR03000 family)